MTQILKLILSALLLYWISRKADMQASLAAVLSLPPGIFLGACMLQLASMAIATLRWSLVMRSLGIAAPFSFFLRSFFKGAFFNQGLPSTIGGDGLRMLDLSRLPSSSKEEAFSGVLVDRLLGLFALLLLNIPILASNQALIPPSLRQPLLATLLALLCMLVGLLAFHRFVWLQVGKMGAFLARLSLRYRQAQRGAALLAVQTSLSLVGHLLAVGVFYLLGQGLGLHFSFLVYLALIPPIALFTMLPISLAGWGLREGAFLGLFVPLGADRSLALSCSMLYGVVGLICSLPGLLVYLRQRHRL